MLVDSDVNPGDYYLFDTATKRADFLRAGRIWIDPKQMRPKEPIALKARDGLELHGYVTRPAGDGPHPMVVIPHSGPHGIRDVWEFDWEVQLLANRGYTVLQVNFRGSGGYGMDFGRAGYGEWGAQDAGRPHRRDPLGDRAEDRVRGPHLHLRHQLRRLCGADGRAREPDLYRCAIGYAGMYDLELMLESGNLPDSRWGRAYLQRVLGSDVAKLRAQSPVYSAQNIKAPVLLIHGKSDGLADFEQAQRMKAALEKNQKKVEWLALGREGYSTYDEDTRREVYERILQFLAANLSARPGTPSGTP